MLSKILVTILLVFPFHMFSCEHCELLAEYCLSQCRMIQNRIEELEDENPSFLKEKEKFTNKYMYLRELGHQSAYKDLYIKLKTRLTD